MTDPQIPYTPPAEPAAPAAEAPPAAEPVDYSVHPVWGKAIETIPEILRAPGTPLYETIKTSEYQSQKAIEEARNSGLPEEWRTLYQEAQEQGVGVTDLAQAYVGQTALAELMNNDPDAFVAELSGQIEALVASGQLTRAQGKAAAATVVSAASGEITDDLLTDEQREIAELKAWKAQQEQAQQSEAQRRQQEAEQARIAQEEEATSNAYFDAFDQAMETSGLMVRDTAGALQSAIPVNTLKLIASTGAQLIDANPRLPHAQAIKQATEQVRQIVESTGGKLGPAPRPQVPVMGASSSMPTGAPTEPAPGGGRNMKDRMAAALAEATRLQGENA